MTIGGNYRPARPVTGFDYSPEEGGPLQPARGDPYFLIEPMPEVLRALADMPANKPISIVGILQHDPENFEASQAAYFEWGKIYQAMTRKLGANHTLAGRVLGDLYVPDSKWDEVSITHFPSASEFLEVTLSEEVLDALPLRRACMVDSYVLVVEDLEDI